MKGDGMRKALLCFVGLMLEAPLSPLIAQESEQRLVTVTDPAAENLQNGVVLPDSISPFGTQKPTEEELAKAQMPKLDGPVTPLDEGNFDKYYYFHRPATDVATAFDDISECDGYARGLQSGYRYQQAPYPYTYTMAGAVGGAIGNVMAAAIFGSAEKRRMRRVNMRACMGFKGYQRFGLPKELWEKFNFEEGLDSVPNDTRRELLLQQALVASRATPGGKVLEP